ncbi:unnamed protein product, partial [Dovyalis caffra]
MPIPPSESSRGSSGYPPPTSLFKGWKFGQLPKYTPIPPSRPNREARIIHHLLLPLFSKVGTLKNFLNISLFLHPNLAGAPRIIHHHHLPTPCLRVGTLDNSPNIPLFLHLDL